MRDTILKTLEIYPWVKKNHLPLSNIDSLQKDVRTCSKCELAKSRTQTVFGVGNTQAKLMLIGEAPGFYEDQKGEPFVGRAGILLTNMLRAIGLRREDVFIANILKCRPPNNRDPIQEEINSCTPYLIEQINLIQPKLLLALGRISAHYLLGNQLTLEKLRGKPHLYLPTQTPLYVTFHPAYLLRTPADKKKAYFDWVTIKEVYQKFN